MQIQQVSAPFSAIDRIAIPNDISLPNARSHASPVPYRTGYRDKLVIQTATGLGAWERIVPVSARIMELFT